MTYYRAYFIYIFVAMELFVAVKLMLYAQANYRDMYYYAATITITRYRSINSFFGTINIFIFYIIAIIMFGGGSVYLHYRLNDYVFGPGDDFLRAISNQGWLRFLIGAYGGTEIAVIIAINFCCIEHFIVRRVKHRIDRNR